jgi:hypothetical protein
MKIYNIRDKNGQASFKGNVIHFAQQIEEVSDSLPRNMNEIDIIIVNESLKSLDKVNQLLIRPHFVFEALNWLITHNCLYNNIKKIPKNLEQFNLSQIMINGIKKFQENFPDQAEYIQSTLEIANQQLTNETNNLESNSPNINLHNYQPINARIAILRSDYNQGMQIFPIESRGQQCTAICAYSIAATFFIPISEWTIDNINDVILAGDNYYSLCQAKLSHNLHPFNRYLEVHEVLGDININDRHISIQYWSNDIVNDTRQGLINTIDLKNKFNEFLAIEPRHAFFICEHYTMAIIKRRNNLYFFDSHSKTPTGRRTDIDKGRSSIMLFKHPNAAAELASYINKLFSKNQLYTMTYVTIFNIQEIQNNNSVNYSSPEINRATSKYNKN